MSEWPLSPRAARVFYNAAEAWLPDEAREADLVAALGPRAEAERAALERALAWLEWSPRLSLRSLRGLSWLPRAERRAWLERLERAGPFRAPARRVRGAVQQAWEVARAARPAGAAAQSLDGA